LRSCAARPRRARSRRRSKMRAWEGTVFCAIRTTTKFPFSPCGRRLRSLGERSEPRRSWMRSGAPRGARARQSAKRTFVALARCAPAAQPLTQLRPGSKSPGSLRSLSLRNPLPRGERGFFSGAIGRN
jgi:hypothetical protein